MEFRSPGTRNELHMKIALAQINTTVADFKGNRDKIREFAGRASALGAHLAVFPEMTLCGYPALDLWEERDFLKANADALRGLAVEVGETALLVGFAQANPTRSGRPARNAVALLHRGKIIAVRYKTLLPTYDVFDEARYFEPARSNKPIQFMGRRIGVNICEDVWTEGTSGRKLYVSDPARNQARAGADVLINLSASPFMRGKSRHRERLFSKLAKRLRRPFFYCNVVGANDELIFDGQSLAFDASGGLLARGKAFQEDLLLLEMPPARPASPALKPLEDIAELELALELGLSDYMRKCGFSKAVIGLSGGIDSALVCALAVKALGPDRVTGVSMPSRVSSPGSVTDARKLARNLGVELLSLPIAPLYDSFVKALRPAFSRNAYSADLALQNLQARIRGVLLMALANKEGSLLLSTGNKSELSVGYCTLYGDMNGGLSVLADVPKTTVYALARHINRSRELIPKASIAKPPSAELKPGQKDQDDLPSYAALDAILTAYVEKRLGPQAITSRKLPARMVYDIVKRIDRAEFKRRQAAPSLKISAKAYGLGRRMPIARSHSDLG